MVTIPIWLLVLLIATNFFMVLFLFMIIYFVCAILDLTYWERHYKKIKPEEKNCPYSIEK